MLGKRTLLAILGGVLAFALVVGSAATLGGLVSTNLGADDATVASCDTSGITTTYSNIYTTSGTAAGFKVDDVTVAGIAAPCVGQSMTVTLTGASNASLGEVTKVVTGTSDAVNFDTATTPQLVLAEAVTGVHVVITGTPAA